MKNIGDELNRTLKFCAPLAEHLFDIPEVEPRAAEEAVRLGKKLAQGYDHTDLGAVVDFFTIITLADHVFEADTVERIRRGLYLAELSLLLGREENVPA